MQSLKGTITALLILSIFIAVEGARKVVIVQVMNTGQLVSATTDWVTWGVTNYDNAQYFCKAPGDGTFIYGNGWIRFYAFGAMFSNAWIAVNNTLTFTLMQYNYGTVNNRIDIVTSGWNTAQLGYYLVYATVAQFRSGGAISIVVNDMSFSLAQPTSVMSSSYAFLV